VERGVGSQEGRSISLVVSHPEGPSSRQEDEAGIEDFDSVLAFALTFDGGDAYRGRAVCQLKAKEQALSTRCERSYSPGEIDARWR
jgi:hypothetical protein